MNKKELVADELQKINVEKLANAKKYRIIVELYVWPKKILNSTFTKHNKDRMEFLRKNANRFIRSNASENLDYDFSLKNIKLFQIKIS